LDEFVLAGEFEETSKKVSHEPCLALTCNCVVSRGQVCSSTQQWQSIAWALGHEWFYVFTAIAAAVPFPNVKAERHIQGGLCHVLQIMPTVC